MDLIVNTEIIKCTCLVLTVKPEDVPTSSGFLLFYGTFGMLYKI